MDPSDWQRIEALFNQLLPLEAKERAQELESSRESKAVIEVTRRMLAADAAPGGDIRAAIRQAVQSLTQPAEALSERDD